MEPSDQTDVQRRQQDPACGRRSATSSPGCGRGRRLWHRLRSERGQAAVEFAIVLPVLLILITGIMQFGELYNRYITLTDAARVGARELAVNAGTGDPCDAAVTQTVNSATGTGLGSGQVKTTFSGPNSSSDTCGTGTYPNRSGGTENSTDTATVSISGYSFTLNLFGIPLIPVNLNPSASEAIE